MTTSDDKPDAATDNVVVLSTATRPWKQRPCANCGKPAVEEYRPFCCKRCADVDLGRWLKEDYRVPSDSPIDPYDEEG